MRPWFERLPQGQWPDLEALNALAEARAIRTASGRPVRFVAPTPADPYYEVQVYESGRVATRAGNGHDLFNALAWLAFPRTKARINALHAAEIPREGRRRGPARDLLTIFDEGGAVALCANPELERMVRNFQWKQLFWNCREGVLRDLRIVVFGHAVLEQALDPWAGITCKVLFAPADADPDAFSADWLERKCRGGSPKLLAPLPIFGFPGWHPASDKADFYDDERFFRPGRRAVDAARA